MTEIRNEPYEAWTPEAEETLSVLLTRWSDKIDRVTLQNVERREPFWHYTRWEAVESIARDQLLWGTHLGYLDDESELTYVRDLVREIRPSAEVDSSAWITEPRLHAFMGMSLRNQFGFSLSGTRDDRAQWAAYAAPPDGVALGFHPKRIFAPPASSGSLFRCTYDRDQQIESARWAVELLERARLPETLFPALLGILVRVWSPWMKPRAYESEDEWRWVPLFAKEILKRETKRGAVPYVECRFYPSALVEVMLSDGRPESLHEMRALLSSAGLRLAADNVTVALNAKR